MKTTTITRKIQLQVVAPDDIPEENRKEYKDLIWKRLRDANKLNYDLHQLAIKTLYSVDSLAELKLSTDQEYVKLKNQYLADTNNKTLKDQFYKKRNNAKKYAAIELGGVLNNKKGNEKNVNAILQKLVYDKIKEHINNLPDNKKVLNSYTTAAIAQNVTNKYKNDQSDVNFGKKTIANYKNTQPIPINRRNGKWFEKINDNYFFIFNSINGSKISLKLLFGRDRSNNKIIIDRIFEENSGYSFSDSSIQLKDKKIYFLLVVKIPQEEHKLDPEKILGVDLGVKYAAYIATNNSKESKGLGDENFYLIKRKIAIDKMKKKSQKNSTLNRGGKGRKRKLQKIYQFKEKDKNFRNNFNHKISKEIINHALNWKCGRINVENLSFSNGENNNRLLRYWAYFDLLTKIEYKCNQHGIIFKKINPKYTSQKCHVCGEIGERKEQANFICLNPNCTQHNKIINADYNAAINIAKAEK